MLVGKKKGVEKGEETREEKRKKKGGRGERGGYLYPKSPTLN